MPIVIYREAALELLKWLEENGYLAGSLTADQLIEVIFPEPINRIIDLRRENEGKRS